MIRVIGHVFLFTVCRAQGGIVDHNLALWEDSLQSQEFDVIPVQDDP
ncbi:MAG: hypothetical protein O7A69_03740 [SAR324 cluster bacterium]|nr:hypothetical protein [SAR324 cluster bacterium]